MPESDFSWIGKGKKQIVGLNSLGYQDFSTEVAKRIAAEHDFMITISEADANPATILESMAWGLILVCSQQSGYSGFPSIVNIPTNDLAKAVSVLRELQEIPERKLKEMQIANWELLEGHFNWERFCRRVINAIESDKSPLMEKPHLQNRIKLCLAAYKSPYSIIRPRNMLRTVLNRIKCKISSF